MALSRVLIQNYRSIERCEFRPSSLTALVGENNAGKSNILQAINTVAARDYVSVNSFDDDNFRDHNLQHDIVIELEFDPPLTYQAFKGTDPVDVPILRYSVTRYKVNSKRGKKGDRRLETGCFNAKGQNVSVLAEAPRKGQQHKYAPLVSIPEELRNQARVIFVGSDRRLADQLPSARYSLLRRLFDDVYEALLVTKLPAEQNGEPTERPAIAVFLERLRSALDVLRIPEFIQLEETLRTRSLENLGYDPIQDADRLRFHFDLFDPMEFFKAIKLFFKEGSLSIDATQSGHGVQNALVMAIFQAYEQLRKKGAIFLIEEPEMYLHPHRQRFFYQTLTRLSEGNQVIYTTHSPHFVAIPSYESVRIIYRNEGNTTKVRASTLPATEQLREKLRKELDPERSELFFAKHVILVEGDTEKLALPEYASRLEMNLDRLGCSVVEVGGKRSLKAFIELVKSFELPMTVVFDTDASDFSKDQKNDEKAYNEQLQGFASTHVHVVELDPNYEAKLRSELGDKAYAALCEKYPGHSKAIRARLIASDATGPIPKFVKEILSPLQPPTTP